MKLIKFRKLLVAFVIGLMTLLATGGIANAQTRRQVQRQRRRIVRQQRRIINQQQRQIQRQIRQSNRYRVYRNGRYYETDNRGAELLRRAVNLGYQQGVIAGRNDRLRRRRSSYYNSSIYRNGRYGYQNYVSSSQYQYYFRQGFQRGYQDGYYGRYRYGTNNNGAFNILGSILSSILNIRRF